MNSNSQIPLKVLKDLSKTSWSGCIEIEEPKDTSVSWNVYFLQGKVQYITSTVAQQTCLEYLWQQLKLGSKCPDLNEAETSQYSFLCQSMSHKQLNEREIQKFLFRLVREEFAHVLSIQRANIQFNPAKRITKSLVSFNLEKLWAKQEEKIKFWRHTRSYLASPFSRLYLEQKNALQFYKTWKTIYQDPELAPLAVSQKLSTFASLFVAKKNLYQIATITNVDTEFLAKHLKSSIEDCLISLLPSTETISQDLNKQDPTSANSLFEAPNEATPTSEDADSTLIVCIDDSKTVQRQMKMTLEAGGYKVIGILDPTKALKTLSQYQPAVIFMDINMPEINGYDLCSWLKKSQRFKEIPIVMLTGRDGMIDRVRAKIVGATDYLTKPCDPNKLITLAKALEKTSLTAHS